MTIKDLNPQAVWSIFEEITKVPRPSGNDEGKLDKIRAWLVDFAKKHNLEYKIDKTGNVAIFRPAAPGYENCKGIVLQGHMDMVAEKGPGSTHNFDTDPIETIIDGEWVRANNTTLGADDGMGLAIALAAVIEPSLQCGPLEALATVDEETGLTGASNIEADMLVGDYLLNLDEEEDGVITMGCAGGLVSIFKFNYKPEAAPKDRVYFEIKFEHLHGGHSGADIHLGYATATKLSSRLLWNIGDQMDYVLACIDAGNLHNAIAHAATVVVGIKPEDKEKLSVVLNTFIADVKNEYKRTEPKMEITCNSVDVPETIIDTDTARRVVDAVYAAPHGIAAMSMEIPGLVETSTNLASVKMREGNQIVVEMFHRSSIESGKYDLTHKCETIFRLAGANEIISEGGYQGWEPIADSHLLTVAQEQWEKLFGIKPEVRAIHAGLECGLFLKARPDMEMISFGPTLRDVHSPAERCHIPAVEKAWKQVQAILKALAEESK